MLNDSAKAVLIEWVRRCAEHGSWIDFDDLHVDELEPSSVGRSAWLNVGIDALRYVTAEFKLYPLSILLAIPLRSGTTPIGVNFSGLDDLENELSSTPPSLYIYSPSAENWRATIDGAQEISLSVEASGIRPLYSEEPSEDGELIRTVFFCDLVRISGVMFQSITCSSMTNPRSRECSLIAPADSRLVPENS